MSANFITKHGFELLDSEIRRIEDVERPDIISKVSEAREKGDLSENAEYHSARERQRLIESRLAYLHDIKSSSQIVDSSMLSNKDIIQFGAKVTLESDSGEKRYITIVSEYESNPNNGFISTKTPVVQSMLRKSIGDTVNIMDNGVSSEFEIIDINYDYIS
jgi:transcription elongation factor GreA